MITFPYTFPNNSTASLDFPLSFIRQYPGPLDTTAVFLSLAELNAYILNNSTAYAGQVVSVSSGSDAGIYIISENIDSVSKQASSADISSKNLQNITDTGNTTTNSIQVANLSAANIYDNGNRVLTAVTSHTHTESDITGLDKYTKAEVDALIQALIIRIEALEA